MVLVCFIIETSAKTLHYIMQLARSLLEWCFAKRASSPIMALLYTVGTRARKRESSTVKKVDPKVVEVLQELGLLTATKRERTFMDRSCRYPSQDA